MPTRDPYESERGMSVPGRFERPWLRSERPAVRRFVRPVETFIRLEAGGGVVLLLAAVAALIWANVSPEGYESVWHSKLSLEGFGLELDEDLRHWINDLLMALFFFLIALEVKREVLFGALAERRLAMVPVAAAIGGMVVPALIYLLVNSGAQGEPSGWAVPLATDVAFALAVLAMIGRMAPGPFRAFLLTVAIVDDVGTIAIIAVAFTEELALAWLGAAGGIALLIVVLQRLSIRALAPYVIAAAALWLATFESGVHATLAGVLLGLLTPARPFHDPDETGEAIAGQLDAIANVDDAEFDEATMLQASRLATEAVSPLVRIETAIHPWSAYVVLPLFALANAGVPISVSAVGDVFSTPIGLGIVLGLVLGKPIGLVAGSWLAVRLTPAELPQGIGLPALGALGLIAGIGFTVALFISALALPAGLADEAKVAILVASLFAGILGSAAFALLAVLRSRSASD